MAGVQSTLSNHDYKNWVKAGLSLKFTRDGLETFVFDVVDRSHQAVLAAVPGNAACQNCTTENVLPCRTRGICNDRGPCHYHNVNNPQKASTPCPMSVCDTVGKQIVHTHRYGGRINSYTGPSWFNTDARLWSTESWEIAKCFMPPGYTLVRSAAETDLPGLVSVVINHRDFQNVVSADLSSNVNIFCKARDVRNAILHSASMQIADDELSSYIAVLKGMLSDPLCLATNAQAQQAVSKLTQIETGALEMTTKDEALVRDEALKAIEEKKKKAIQDVQAKGQEQIENIETAFATNLEASNLARSRSIKAIEATKEEEIKCVQAEVEKAKKDIRNGYDDHVKLMDALSKDFLVDFQKQTDNIKEAAVGLIRQEAETAVKTIQQEKSELQDAKRCHNISEEIELKQNFQKDLIAFYKEDCLTIPINPLKQKETADIADLYAKPCLRRVDPHNKSSKDGKLIESYEDIFKKDAKVCKKIYITGDAGMGKSTLCQHLVATWCRAHSERSATETLTKDEESMRMFDFVFYITLRDITGPHNHVEEMIKDLLLRRLDDAYCNILSKVLQTEQCLIILDGLDEWTSAKLPDKKFRPKCSIITTTRPWKLEVLRLKTSEIDQHMVLTGLDYNSSCQLINNAVTVLNRKYGLKKSADDFNKKLKESNVAELRYIPVVLKQLLCLWHGGKPLGYSKCSMYSGMINLLVQLAEDKNLDGNQEYSKLKEDFACSGLQFPKCFDGNKKCDELKPVIYALAKLSFETLFARNTEASLVFECSAAEMHGMSKTQIDISLKIGILSQSKILTDCNTESKKLSFIHKTFQEFLAALYVSMNEETIGIITIICNSIEKMLEMEQVLLFVSGMNPDSARKLSEHICEMASRDGSYVQQYRQKLGDYRDFKLGRQIQDGMINCARESSNNGHPTHLRLEDVFIDEDLLNMNDAQHIQHLENLIHTNSSNVRSIAINTNLSYRLSEAFAEVDSLQKLHIDTKYITAGYTVIGNFVYNMVCKSKETFRCLILDYFRRDFLSMPGLSQEQFSSMLHSLSNLEGLKFGGIRLSHDQIECLMAFLSRSTHMRRIYLYIIECTECARGACRYQLDLAQHTHLETLYLAGLYVDSVQLKTTSMLELTMVLLHKPGGTSSVIDGLRNAPKLQKLVLYDTDSEKGSVYMHTLLGIIPTLVQLKRIILDGVDFGDNKFALSDKMVNIERVTLWRVTMTSKSFRCFVDSIPDTQHSVKIELDKISIRPAEKISFNCVALSQRFIVEDIIRKNASGEYSLKFHTLQENASTDQMSD